MIGHVRDFESEIDPYQKIIDPEQDAVHRMLANQGPRVFEALGATPIEDTFDGQAWTFSGGSSPVTLRIREPDIVFPALLGRGSVGAFYTYTEGLWEAEAQDIPPDIDTGHPEADSMVVMNEAFIEMTNRFRRIGNAAANLIAPVRDRWAQRKAPPDEGESKDDIGMHYDIDRRLYVGPHGFLTDTYNQYSSGLVLPGQEIDTNTDIRDVLELVQGQKVEEIGRKLGLDSDEPVSVLEVGSGFGGLAVGLAERYPNARITSLTLSDEQLAHARQRAEAAGVADRVTFVGEDYRNHEADRPYDRIVSVEVIEAVHWKDLDTYFDTLVRLANPKTGVVVIQAITTPLDNYARHRHNKNNFMNVSIFPNGYLHPAEVIADHMQRRNWETHEQTDLGQSYPWTLRSWRGNLFAAREALTQVLLDEGNTPQQVSRLYRGFGNMYLAGSEAAFRKGRMGDKQLVFRPAAIRRS